MNEKPYGDFNVFIKQCVKQLKENRVCYCYTLEQIEEIKNKYKSEVRIEKNECGYTLSIPRRKEIKK